MDGFSERPFDEARHSSPFFARQRRAPQAKGEAQADVLRAERC
jgi:hypothetical protein